MFFIFLIRHIFIVIYINFLLANFCVISNNNKHIFNFTYFVKFYSAINFVYGIIYLNPAFEIKIINSITLYAEENISIFFDLKKITLFDEIVFVNWLKNAEEESGSE